MILTAIVTFMIRGKQKMRIQRNIITIESVSNGRVGVQNLKVLLLLLLLFQFSPYEGFLHIFGFFFLQKLKI